MSQVTIILGPPAAGKSTYVAERFEKGDVVVDWDRLLSALTLQPEHTWIDWVCPLVEAARSAVYRQVRATRHLDGHVFIVACRMPESERADWRRVGARIVVIDTPAETCIERIHASPQRANVAGAMIAAVDRWWAEHRRR